MPAAAADLAAALFGKTRRNVLALLFGQPGRSFYLREIATRAAGGMGQVQRELAHLAAAGLVQRERRANQVHFRANPGAPIYGELVAIVTKTFGVADVLRQALAAYKGRIRMAFVYGSIAKGTAHAASDIDLLLIAELAPSALAPALAESGERLGRRISMVAYSPGEFAQMLRAEHHFIRAVLEGPKIWLVGDARSLDELRYRQPGKSRARRAARR
jgi:predicted nucleotidyltransferase